MIQRLRKYSSAFIIIIREYEQIPFHVIKEMHIEVILGFEIGKKDI